jgi:putative peptidoglycan binding protein
MEPGLKSKRLCAGLAAACAVGLLCAANAAAQNSSAASPAPKATQSKTSGTKPTSGKRSRKRRTRVRGQRNIDVQRAQAIQEALIREHYLSGTATGKWNQQSEDAMRRYQGDHGWQTKTVPDSRALIKLGLGPSKDHLLNPESAMTAAPDAPSLNPVSHSANPTTPATKTPSAEPATPAASQKDPSNPH